VKHGIVVGRNPDSRFGVSIGNGTNAKEALGTLASTSASAIMLIRSKYVKGL
jgi:hypothetical protein